MQRPVSTAFPEDSLPEGKYHTYQNFDEVVDFLWRDERVPEWINVQIEETTDSFVYIDLVCCGRYTVSLQENGVTTKFRLSRHFPARILANRISRKATGNQMAFRLSRFSTNDQGT
ncbi:MAG: hypothetical protein K1Y36_28330 [Blastocatellia bacterium]|nr:hypothetical protein [Blastocatellia bacterium]